MIALNRRSLFILCIFLLAGFLFCLPFAQAAGIPITLNQEYLQKLKAGTPGFPVATRNVGLPLGGTPFQAPGRESIPNSGRIGAPIANPIGKVFRINDQSTEANAVFPEADGYLVFTSRSTKQNVTKFDLNGKLVFSKDYLDLAQVVYRGYQGLAPFGC